MLINTLVKHANSDYSTEFVEIFKKAAGNTKTHLPSKDSADGYVDHANMSSTVHNCFSIRPNGIRQNDPESTSRGHCSLYKFLHSKSARKNAVSSRSHLHDKATLIYLAV